MGETAEAFKKLVKEVHYSKSRINSEHTYEIFDNIDFKKGKYAEVRYKKYKVQ